LGRKCTDHLGQGQREKNLTQIEVVRYFFNQVWQFVFASESANLSISKSKKGDYFEVVDN
jgi:hypothetical protein